LSVISLHFVFWLFCFLNTEYRRIIKEFLEKEQNEKRAAEKPTKNKADA